MLCCTKKVIAGAALVTLATLTVTACSQGEGNVARGNREGILHYGNGAEPQSLDPHVMSGVPEVTIARALFEGLVTMHPGTLEVVPGVAQRWEFSRDRRTITFFLNPQAKWSNGDAVSAQDFVWSLQRSLNPEMGNQLAYTLYPIVNAEAYTTGQLTDPNALGVSALDAHTLQIKLNNPNPFFLQTLATYPAYPVHRATLEAHGKSTDRFSPWTKVENFVGNGPFALTEWQLNRRIVIHKSDTYWDADKVELNSVVFHPTDNTSTEEKMFRVGQLHFTQLVPLNKIPAYREMEESPYRQQPMFGTYYLPMNIDRAPLDDIRVRQALALAIDKKTLIASVLHGTALPAPAFTPPGTPGYTSPDLLRYDPAAARALLAEAGYPNGEGWPGMEYLYNTAENHRKVAVALQQMWKDELNIDMQLLNLEWKVYLGVLQEKDFQISRAGWVATVLEPGSFLDKFITEGGTNRTGFSNERYDEIILRLAPQSTDPEQRMRLMQEAEAILMQELPLIPLYTYNSKHLVQPSVKGAIVNLLDIQDFKFISLDPDAPVWKSKD